MKITRDVVTDLLPLYESGEASPDTRALVEAYFRSDPDFERLAKAARTTSPRTSTSADSVPNGLEHEAVSRTRKALRRQSWTLALAIFFTCLPFLFVYIDGVGVRFFMWRDQPGSRLFLLSAAWLWWRYYRQAKAMQPSGW